jgi:hypothetical protein
MSLPTVIVIGILVLVLQEDIVWRLRRRKREQRTIAPERGERGPYECHCPGPDEVSDDSRGFL